MSIRSVSDPYGGPGMNPGGAADITRPSGPYITGGGGRRGTADELI